MQTWYDDDGEILKQAVLEQGPVLVERSDTSNTYLSAIHARFVYDAVNETLTASGAVFVDTLPGEGVIIHDVGRVVFDGLAPDPGSIVFLAGPHDVLLGDVDILEVYCSVLA